MSARIYVEGGGTSKQAKLECRQGFHKLLARAGFSGRMPKLIASGPRQEAFSDFKSGLAQAEPGEFVALLVDSEAPVADPEKTWRHLEQHDQWSMPAGARDEQVLLMTTCMETWIATDRETLKRHYGQKLQVSALPPLQDIEARLPQQLQDALIRATRDCPNQYKKGTRSFTILGLLKPDTLKASLPSFTRVIRVLNEKL